MYQYNPLFGSRYDCKSQFWTSWCSNGNGPRISCSFQQVHEIQPKKPSLVEQGSFCPLVLSARPLRVARGDNLAGQWTDEVGTDMHVVCNIFCFICLVMGWGWMS